MGKGDSFIGGGINKRLALLRMGEAKQNYLKLEDQIAEGNLANGAERSERSEADVAVGDKRRRKPP